MTTPILYVAGWGRCGSTLLDRLFGQLPDVVSLGEMRSIWQRGCLDNDLCGCGALFDSCAFWQRIGLRAFGGWDQVDARAMVRLNQRFDLGWRTSPILHRGLPGNPELETYVSALSAVYLAIQQETGCRLIVDSSKSPSYGDILRRIPAMPVRLLHLVRDPRGVAYSWWRYVERPSGGSAERSLRRIGVAGAAARYLVYNAAAGRMASAEDRIRVRYEDLAADPRQRLAELADAVSLDVGSDDWSFFSGPNQVKLQPNHTVDGNPMRFRTGLLDIHPDVEWRSRLTWLQQRTVEAVTAPLLIRYGYARKASAARANH